MRSRMTENEKSHGAGDSVCRRARGADRRFLRVRDARKIEFQRQPERERRRSGAGDAQRLRGGNMPRLVEERGERYEKNVLKTVEK